MYKPSGIAPYPTQGFHYGPRHVGPGQTPAPSPAPMPHPGTDNMHGPPRAPLACGFIPDLPMPVPTADSQVQWDYSLLYKNKCVL